MAWLTNQHTSRNIPTTTTNEFREVTTAELEDVEGGFIDDVLTSAIADALEANLKTTRDIARGMT